jgi:hypothetical protein
MVLFGKPIKKPNMQPEKFIFCLEVLPDIEAKNETLVYKNLENLALQYQLPNIYKTCDTIEGFEESLANLLYNDVDFANYEIIYIVATGEKNNICINNYYYSLTEIAELFEGKMKGKIIHFANLKVLDLSQDEAQFFLDVTCAKAISGYGSTFGNTTTSINLDFVFFSQFEDTTDVVEVVEELHKKHNALCKLLNFRLYYNA